MAIEEKTLPRIIDYIDREKCTVIDNFGMCYKTMTTATDLWMGGLDTKDLIVLRDTPADQYLEKYNITLTETSKVLDVVLVDKGGYMYKVVTTGTKEPNYDYGHILKAIRRGMCCARRSWKSEKKFIALLGNPKLPVSQHLITIYVNRELFLFHPTTDDQFAEDWYVLNPDKVEQIVAGTL